MAASHALEKRLSFLSVGGERVVRVMEAIVLRRGLPAAIVADSGPEFAGRALDAWAYRQGVKLQFIEPGKPVQNAFVESFNDKFRKECLNENWFESLAETRAIVEIWRRDYNSVRPHRSLDDRTPEEFSQQAARLRAPQEPCADPPVASTTSIVIENGGLTSPAG